MDDTFVTFFLFPYADLDTVLLLPAPLPFLTPFALPLLLFGDLFVHESADVIYHFLVTLESRGIKFFDVITELEKRKNQSGYDEKKNRKK